MNCKGARITVQTVFGTIRRKGRTTFLIPAAVLTRRRCRSLARQFRRCPFRVNLLDHFHAGGRRSRALTNVQGKAISVIVNARQVLSGSIIFTSLKLLIISRRRQFNIGRGRHLGRLGTSISMLALATAPVPHALRVSVLKIESLSIVRAPPTGHCPIRACIVRRGGKTIQSTVRERLTHKNRTFCLCGQIRAVRGGTRRVHRLIPSIHITITRNRVARIRLRGIVVSFVRNHCSILIAAAVVRANMSVPGIGALFVRGTSQVNLSRLCRLHKHINEAGQVTCTCLVCRPGGVLARIDRGELRTVGRFARLNTNFGVTVHSLSVHKTKGLLNTRRRNFVSSIKFSLCSRVLKRTITTGHKLGTGSGHSVIRVSLDVSTCVPTSCVRSRQRGVSFCGQVRHVRDITSRSRVSTSLVSHFNSCPRRISSLLRINLVGGCTRGDRVRAVGHRNRAIIVAFSRRTAIHLRKPTIFRTLDGVPLGTRVGLGGTGLIIDIIVKGLPGHR